MTANAGAPDPMGADPNMGAGIGNMAEDPNAGMPAEEDPGMEGGDMGDESTGDGDSTMDIINSLTPKDQETVRAYALSLKTTEEPTDVDNEGGMPNTEEPAPNQAGQGVMMEITKGRLKQVQQRLRENFRDKNDGKEVKKREEKVNKNTGKKSPFDSPLD
jgi:hypothetical protein